MLLETTSNLELLKQAKERITIVKRKYQQAMQRYDRDTPRWNDYSARVNRLQGIERLIETEIGSYNKR